MAKRGIVTREEKVAQSIIDFLADMRLDLDMIGIYFGRYARTVIYNRLQHIAEVAKYHKEVDEKQDYQDHLDYIKNISA
jgi:hypothetical protein